MHMRLILFGLTLAATTVACRPPTSSEIGISIFMEANPTVVQVGDTVTFIVNISANNLFGVVIAYGDSVSDQYSTGGASTARVTFKHAYANSGTFTARATVSDAIVGDREVTQLIVVNPRIDSTQSVGIATRHAAASP